MHDGRDEEPRGKRKASDSVAKEIATDVISEVASSSTAEIIKGAATALSGAATTALSSMRVPFNSLGREMVGTLLTATTNLVSGAALGGAGQAAFLGTNLALIAPYAAAAAIGTAITVYGAKKLYDTFKKPKVTEPSPAALESQIEELREEADKAKAAAKSTGDEIARVREIAREALAGMKAAAPAAPPAVVVPPVVPDPVPMEAGDPAAALAAKPPEAPVPPAAVPMEAGGPAAALAAKPLEAPAAPPAVAAPPVVPAAVPMEAGGPAAALAAKPLEDPAAPPAAVEAHAEIAEHRNKRGRLAEEAEKVTGEGARFSLGVNRSGKHALRHRQGGDGSATHHRGK